MSLKPVRLLLVRPPRTVRPLSVKSPLTWKNRITGAFGSRSMNVRSAPSPRISIAPAIAGSAFGPVLYGPSPPQQKNRSWKPTVVIEYVPAGRTMRFAPVAPAAHPPWAVPSFADRMASASVHPPPPDCAVVLTVIDPLCAWSPDPSDIRHRPAIRTATHICHSRRCFTELQRGLEVVITAIGAIRVLIGPIPRTHWLYRLCNALKSARSWADPTK